MEDPLGSSVLEDNLEIGLSFGDDNQKIEKMNQSFLLLKKKLFRSHDLIQQYSNKMKECERLRMELDNAQREVERYKHQHLTNAAKVVKLNMHNNSLEETNRRLEKLVSEHEIKIAGDQRHVQQLICKVEDIEDRHSEKIMQIELEKSGLQVKIKELEQEIKNIQKVNGVKKLEKKVVGTNAKRKGKTEELKSPKKSQIPGDLELINEEDPSDSHALQYHNQENIEKKLSNVPEKPEKTYRDMGVNVSIDTTPPKPIMLEKNIMTDDFYSIKDNPYPLFCDECERMLEPMPVDAICRAMTRLPPLISQIPASPEANNSLTINNSDNEAITTIKCDQSSPTVLDSLQRRIRMLEKKIKRKNKIENTRQSCCNHSHSSSCCNTQNLVANPQMQMMEFFNRIMQLPGMMRKKKKKKRKTSKICHHQQFRRSDTKLMKSPRKKKRKSDCVNNENDWDVEPENSEHFDDAASTPAPVSTNFNYEERRESVEESPEEIPSKNTRSPNFPVVDDNGEVNNSRKRKRREESNNPTVNNRSNILKNLRRLKTKKNHTAVVAHNMSTTKESLSNTANPVRTDETIPLKRRRIAHIPRKLEESSNQLNVNNYEQSVEASIEKLPKIDDLEEKRITRSSRRSMVIRNETNETNNKNLVDEFDTAHEESDSPTVGNLEKIEKNPETLMNGNIEKNVPEVKPPKSPEPSNTHDSPPTPAPIDSMDIGDDSEINLECSDKPEHIEDSLPFDNVRELRNRQVNVSQSLIKSKSMTPTHSDDSEAPRNLPVTSNNSQSREKIEILLDRHIASTKKRPGRKPKVLEIARIIHKNNENRVKQELGRLINSGQWDDTIYTSVLTNLLNIASARTIAKAVVDFIVERSDVKEALDCTYTPPAPPMTRSQQLIVTLLKDLSSRFAELIEITFTAIEYTLFRMNSPPEWNAVEDLARIFTVLARMKKDRERVRIMCCDALYCLQKKSMLILHTVITSWPEVLPMYNEERNQFLVISIIHIMRMHQSDSKISQIKKLVSAYYNYPEVDPSSTKLACRIMDSLANNYNKCDEAAMILLCKREGTDWMYNNVVYGGLMEDIVRQRCSSVYDSLKLVGFLLKSCPVSDEQGRVMKIIQQLRDLAAAKDTPAEIQEGAVSALLSLSRHRFEDVAVSVLNWQPPRELPAVLQEQLNTFFSARAVASWSHIKFKSRKYANSIQLMESKLL